MDELLTDFLTDSAEQLEAIGAEWVGFEQGAPDARVLDNLSALLHAIAGTCGLLGLPRPERIARAAEAAIDRLRASAMRQTEANEWVFVAIDGLKTVLADAANGRGDIDGDDAALVERLANAGARPAASQSKGAVVPLNDVVRASAEKLGGQVALLGSARGGAAVTLRLPPTRAMVPAFVARLGGESFAVQQSCVVGVGGADFAREAAPLRALLGLAEESGEPKGRFVIRLRAGARVFAIVVDEIVDAADVILEPLPFPPRQSPLFSGAAILSDGAVVLVLDPSGLADAMGLSNADAPASDLGPALLVEPNPFLREMIGDALSRRNFAVTAVADAREAIAAIGSRRRFAAVLVDLESAAAGRGHFARQIRAAAPSPSPMLIGLAAHGGPASQARARAARLDFAVGIFDRATLVSQMMAALASPFAEMAA